jgi:hypothetical protein
MPQDPTLPEDLVFFRWWGPDPALRFILEAGDPAQKQAAISAGIRAQVEILQAQIGYLNAVQQIVGRTGQP